MRSLELEWATRTSPPRLGVGAHLDTTPFWKGFGAAMSSSPWEWPWNGDEDVATPFDGSGWGRIPAGRAGGSAGRVGTCATEPEGLPVGWCWGW
jgi:hypothetical protein